VTDDLKNPGAPTPVVHTGRLNSLHSVRRELARLYRDLRNERVSPRIAGTAGYLLTAITKCLEVELLETRIDALEQRAGVIDKPGRQKYALVGHG
jgi:hypothetical protein